MAAKGWVYFIRGECSGLIKIGWTRRHPSRRLAALQCVSPVALDPIGVIGARPSTERLLHRKFAEMRDHGEWFWAIMPLLDWIDENAQPWPAEGAESPGESKILRADLEQEFRRRRIPIGGPSESVVDRDKRIWWECQGLDGPPPLDRIVNGVNGWLLLKEGDTERDYWAFIHQHQQFTMERLRWAAADGDFHEVFAQVMGEDEAAKLP